MLNSMIAFNHNQSSNSEEEYDRLRGLARQEHSKKSSLLDRVRDLVSLKAWLLMLHLVVVPQSLRTRG